MDTPMLTSARIQNFRSCRDVRLDRLGHVVGLVGRNGTGKTTLLQALEWVASTALASDNMSARIASSDPGEALADPCAELEIAVSNREYRYRLGRTFWREAAQGRPQRARDEESLHTRSKGESEWQTLFERVDEQVYFGDMRSPVELISSAAAMPTLSSLLKRTEPLQPHLHAVMDTLRRVRYYPGHLVFYPPDTVAEEPSGPISEDLYDGWVAAHSSGRKRTSIILRLLFAHETAPERFSELKQLMGPEGLGLLRDIQVVTLGDLSPGRPLRGRPHRYFDVLFSPMEGRAEVTLDQLSGGTRHVLYLILGLLYDESSTLLIEQPEDGIHPGLLPKLIDLLRVNADPAQIVFTSHSPIVLSSLQPDDIRLVDLQGGATRVRALTADEIQRAQDYLHRDGSLAEFLEIVQEE